MPRRVQKPPFPDTPGKWLACYRYRWQPGGRACSPEQLGDALGVSGTTVRRWEAGQLRPTREDITRFSNTCGLTPLEEYFLLQAFQNRALETPCSMEAFEKMARAALISEHPAFIMDSLFYLRARNTYMREMVKNVLTPLAENTVVSYFGPGRSQMRGPTPVRMVRSFWFATAGLNGSLPFRRLIDSLRATEGFEDAWWEIALTQAEAEDANNVPSVFAHNEHGLYRVHMTRITVPPVYYMREYVPVDDVAIAYVRDLREAAPNDIEPGSPHHWAFTE